MKNCIRNTCISFFACLTLTAFAAGFEDSNKELNEMSARVEKYNQEIVGKSFTAMFPRTSCYSYGMEILDKPDYSFNAKKYKSDTPLEFSVTRYIYVPVIGGMYEIKTQNETLGYIRDNVLRNAYNNYIHSRESEEEKYRSYCYFYNQTPDVIEEKVSSFDAARERAKAAAKKVEDEKKLAAEKAYRATTNPEDVKEAVYLDEDEFKKETRYLGPVIRIMKPGDSYWHEIRLRAFKSKGIIGDYQIYIDTHYNDSSPILYSAAYDKTGKKLQLTTIDREVVFCKYSTCLYREIFAINISREYMKSKINNTETEYKITGKRGYMTFSIAGGYFGGFLEATKR